MKSNLKIIGGGILSILFAIFLASCGGGNGSSEPTTDNGSSVALASIIVKDATGQNLGYYLGAEEMYEHVKSAFSVYSPSGYIYSIDWSGALLDDEIAFSDENCTGTPYDVVLSERAKRAKQFGKTVLYANDKLYRYKNSLITQGYVMPTYTTYKSYMDRDYSSGNLTCRNQISDENMIELELTTRTEVGIPNSVSPPITLHFQ